MTKKILTAVTSVLVALAFAGTARADLVEVEIYLTHADAVGAVRASGGSVHRCRRVASRHFHCRATWWYEQHEAEVEPDGSLVNETITYFPEELTCEVGLKGVRINSPEASS